MAGKELLLIFPSYFHSIHFYAYSYNYNSYKQSIPWRLATVIYHFVSKDAKGHSELLFWFSTVLAHVYAVKFLLMSDTLDLLLRCGT